jgi:hypothetical protein
LQAVRNFLKAEGERVQRELTSYAQAAQAALSSVELISEALVRERHAAQLFDGVRRLPPPANEPEGG